MGGLSGTTALTNCSRPMRLTFTVLLFLIGTVSLLPYYKKGKKGYYPHVGRAAVAQEDKEGADAGGEAAPQDAKEDPAEADKEAEGGAEETPAEGEAEGVDEGAAKDGEEGGDKEAAEEEKPDDAAGEGDAAVEEEAAPADGADPPAEEAPADDAAAAGGEEPVDEEAEAAAGAGGAGGAENADAGGELVSDVADSESGTKMANSVIAKLKELNLWLKGVVTYWDKMAKEVPAGAESGGAEDAAPKETETGDAPAEGDDTEKAAEE